MLAGARVFAFGDFELDESCFELRQAGKPLELEPTPFRLLLHLIQQRERVVPREELLEAVWPDVVVSDTALSSALKEVRRALGDDGKEQRWIQTLRRRGIRFVGEAAETSPRPRAAEPAQAPAARRTEASVTTILFTDLVASTERVQRLGDERARVLFEALHVQMTSLVEAHAGEELQWLGDGMMAAFHSTSDAVRCAIALQRTMRQRADRPAVRVGLNVGEILRTGSGYFGTPVVVASRLCDRAEAGQILASGVVAGLLAGRRAFRFRELGPAALQGIEAPLPVCEVEYEAEAGTPLVGGTPFVGRTEELARLGRAFDRAEAGEGGLVLVTGEPGIGKTRLVQELAELGRERGARVLVGRCFEGEGQRPYGPFAEVLESYAAEASREELQADLAPYGAQLGELTPRLRARLPNLPELPRLSGDAERERLFYALVQLLLATAKRAPLVLVLDDLHWADGATLALLRHVGRFARQGRLVLLGTYRDTEVGREHPLAKVLAALRREAEYEHIALAGLEPGSVTRLLQMLAQQEIPDAFAERMAAATGGNPFFLREFLVHLVESGTLRRQDGVWSAGLSLEEMGIPEGVRQVLGLRMARLSEDANRLLGVASGFHGGFSFEVARQVADLGESEALDALDEALDAQLVRPAGGGDRYEFGHDLIRHTLDAVRSPSRRARLHRRIAEEMQRGEVDAAAELAWQYHRSRELPGAERGVPHCLAAAEQAERAAAQEEVADFLRMALDLLPRGDGLRPRLLARRSLALAWSLQADEAARVGSEAAELLAKTEGGDAAGDYLVLLTRALDMYARPQAWGVAEQGLRHLGSRRDVVWAYLTWLDQLRRGAADPDSPGIPLDSPVVREVSRVLLRSPPAPWEPPHFGHGCIAFTSRQEILEQSRPAPIWQLAGDLRRGLALCVEEARRSLATGDLAATSFALAHSSMLHSALGDLEASRGCIAWASRVAASLSDASVVVLNLLAARGMHAFITGDGLEDVVSIGEALLERAPPDQSSQKAGTRAVVACAYAHQGRESDALRSLEHVLPAISQAAGWGMNYPLIIHMAVETLWVLERIDHVEPLERNLREKTLAPDFRTRHADARLSMARLCALQRRSDEAVAWFSKAREVLEEQGARPLRAITDYDEGLMYLRRGDAGDRQRAEPLLELALAAFRAIGMPGWERRARERLDSA